MSKEKQNELLINDVESNNSVRIRNKRIDEMAEVICKSYAEKRDCETCPTEWCYAAEYATLLYHAGYRKQIEGKWIDNRCSICGKMPMGEEIFDLVDTLPPRFDWFMNFCPNCGAKMKGADNEK